MDREHAVDDERAPQLGRDHPGDEVDALEHHRPALVERALQRGLDAGEHVAGLVEEAEQRRVARLLLLRLRQPEAGLEARVVDRRHELLREEGAHRLPDEVGRGDARDPEPVGDLGRDRRLARAGAAADEQDHRAGRAPAGRGSGAAGGRRAGRARRRAGRPRARARRSRSTVTSPRCARSASVRRASSYASSSVTPTAVSARAIRPFEYGVSCPPRKCRSPLRRSVVTRRLLRQPQQLGVEIAAVRGAATSLPASTTSTPRSRAASATTSIAAAFSSMRKTSASTRASSSRSARAVGEVPETWTTSAPCSSRRCAAKRACAGSGAVVKKATVRPSTGSTGRGRSVARDHARRELGEPSRSSSQPEPSLRHRQHDEVGEQLAVRRSGSRSRPRDPAAR